MPYDIGATLKKLRTEAGLSVKEVSDILISKGFKAGESTIYSWENNNSQPTPGALLTMCKAYNVNDVLSTFGYGAAQKEELQFSAKEIEMVKKHRSLDFYGSNAVNSVLEIEYVRCTEEKESKVLEFVLDSTSGEFVARNKTGITQDMAKKMIERLKGLGEE